MKEQSDKGARLYRPSSSLGIVLRSARYETRNSIKVWRTANQEIRFERNGTAGHLPLLHLRCGKLYFPCRTLTCFSPPLSWRPCSPTFVSYPSGNCTIKSCALAWILPETSVETDYQNYCWWLLNIVEHHKSQEYWACCCCCSIQNETLNWTLSPFGHLAVVLINTRLDQSYKRAVPSEEWIWSKVCSPKLYGTIYKT